MVMDYFGTVYNMFLLVSIQIVFKNKLSFRTVSRSVINSKYVDISFNWYSPFVCIMLIYFFLYQRIPTEEELVVEMFIITSLLYFTMNFYNFHLVHHIEK